MVTLLPPGLEGDLTKVTSGGDDTQWMTFDQTKFYTNAFIIQNGKVGSFSQVRVSFDKPMYTATPGVQKARFWEK
jgi:hypothetical protein